MLISQRYRWEEAGSGREVHGTTELHCQVDHRFHQLRITLMSGSLSSSPVGRWNPGANLSLIHCWRTQVLRRLHHFSGCWTLERVKIDPRVCQPPCCDSLPHSWGTWKTPSSQNTSHNSPGMERRGGGWANYFRKKALVISHTYPVTERIHKFNCCPCPKTLDFKLTSPLPCSYLFLTPMIAIPIFNQCLIGF